MAFLTLDLLGLALRRNTTLSSLAAVLVFDAGQIAEKGRIGWNDSRNEPVEARLAFSHLGEVVRAFGTGTAATLTYFTLGSRYIYLYISMSNGVKETAKTLAPLKS